MESGAISGTHAVPRIPLRFIRATTEHDGEFKLIKWMMGLLLGGVAALK